MTISLGEWWGKLVSKHTVGLEVAQQVMALASEPDDLSLIPQGP